MRNRKSIDIISIIFGAAGLVVILLSFSVFLPRIDKKLHGEIGRTLAKESVKLLPSGGKIIVITRDTEAFSQPTLALSFEAFQEEVRRAGVTIAAVQTIQLDPLRPVEVPPGDFYELLRRSPADHVIVSLLGPPVLSEEQRAKLGRPKTRVVALCTGNMAEVVDLKTLFQSGLLHAAIVNRPFSSKDGVPPGSFDQLYTVMKADSAGVGSAAL